jgi:demethylmenaquinone methyltransferase / 2-methoxy-6-polyprenyl-1,4-benzoquinol methylase
MGSIAPTRQNRYVRLMSTAPQSPDPAAENASEEMVSFGFQEVPRAEKAGKVRAVFDSVAKNYDVMNDVMSLGRTSWPTG